MTLQWIRNGGRVLYTFCTHFRFAAPIAFGTNLSQPSLFRTQALRPWSPCQPLLETHPLRCASGDQSQTIPAAAKDDTPILFLVGGKKRGLTVVAVSPVFHL